MRKLRTKSLLGIIVTTMVMPFFSCKKEEAKVEESLQINFDSDSYTLEVGKTKQINLTYTPSTKKLSFIYGSTDENVLTVDNTGLMKGELKGKCKVFAYYDANKNNSYDDGEVRKEADVKVVNNPSISNKKENVVFYSDYAASLNTGEGGQGDSSLTLPDERFNHLNVDIYNIDVEGEIPYIKLEDYAKMAKYNQGINLIEDMIKNMPGYEDLDLSKYFSVKNEGNGKYRLDIVPLGEKIHKSFFQFEDNNIRGVPLYFDVNENVITSPDISKFQCALQEWNNGIPNEQSSPMGIVTTSDKSKYVKGPSEAVFDLSPHYLNIYEFDNSCYVPLDVVLLFLSEYATYYYNGYSISNTTNIDRSLVPYFYSNENSFAFTCSHMGSTLTLDFTKTSENSKTYNALSKMKNITSNGQLEDAYAKGSFVFNNNNTATLSFAIVNSPETSIQSANPQVTEYTYTLSNGIYTVSSKPYTYTDELGQSQTAPAEVVAFINTKSSNFGNNTYGENMKRYAYNFLTYRLDNFYGIKNDLGVDTFTKYFKETKRQISSLDGPISSSPDTIYNYFMNTKNIDEYSVVLNYVVSNILGDGHTVYMGSSPLVSNFNTLNDSTLASLNNSDRSNKIMTDMTTFSNLREEAINSYLNLEQQSMPMKLSDECFITEGSTAILMFDSFTGSPITYEIYAQISEMIDNQLLPAFEDYRNDRDVTSTYQMLNSFVGNFAAFLFAFKVIEKLPEIKNVVFDITNNGGGAVLAVPQILSFLTDDPYFTDSCTIDGSICEYHYKVDLNGDKTIDSKDTYKGKYNFYVLQSDMSFSCGSLFPAAVKNAGIAKIIGARLSGGGACSVSYGSDVFGTQLRLSSTHASMVRQKDGSWTTNDRGVEADYVLDTSYWYDFAKLNTYLNSLS